MLKSTFCDASGELCREQLVFAHNHPPLNPRTAPGCGMCSGSHTSPCCFSPALSTACGNVFLVHFCPVHNNPVINTLSSLMLYRQQLAEWKQNSFWSYHFVLLTIKKYIKTAYVHFTSILNTDSNTNSLSSQTCTLFHSVFRSSWAVIT